MCLCLLWLLIKLRASDCRRRRRTTKVYFYGQSPYTETERKTPTRNNGQLLSAKIHFGPKTREKRSNNRRGGTGNSNKVGKVFSFYEHITILCSLIAKDCQAESDDAGKKQSRAERQANSSEFPEIRSRYVRESDSDCETNYCRYVAIDMYKYTYIDAKE